jgi:hypothetical protein
MKSVVYIIVIIIVFLLGVLATKWWLDKSNVHSKEDTQVIIEKMKNVLKLVTVEGNFSEVYEYKDFIGYDLSFFRKKALIRVKAKVSAGVDLENMKIEVTNGDKTIHIANFPTEAKILSIDHNLDYYDISEGTFNSFEAEDYNKMNQKAKDVIAEQALKSNLLPNALKQSQELINVIKTMGEGAGYKVVIDTVKTTPLKN